MKTRGRFAGLTAQQCVLLAIEDGITSTSHIAQRTGLTPEKVKGAIRNLRSNGKLAGTIDKVRVSARCVLAEVWR